MEEKYKLLKQLGANKDLAKARPLMTSYLDVIYYCNPEARIGFKLGYVDYMLQAKADDRFHRLAAKYGIDAAIDYAIDDQQKIQNTKHTSELFTIINPYTGRRVHN